MSGIDYEADDIKKEDLGDQPTEKEFADIPPTNTQAREHHSSSASSAGDNATVEKGQVEVSSEEPPRKVTGVAWFLVVLAILSSSFLFALDNTVVADVQPNIVERFGSVNKLPWLSSSFLLSAASTNLVWGKIYGQFDAKYLYIFCMLVFEIGSAVCGAAPNINALIVGRAICGLGGSGLYVGVMTLLSVSTTMKERPMYIGLTGLTWGLGTVLGPIIGGAFADSKATWRWAFYINLCVGGLWAPVYIFLLPSSSPRHGVPIKARLREIDFLGTLLIIGAFVSGVMAISFGGILYPWSSARIIALFCTSGILFILFGCQQTFAILTTPARRIFPLHFLRSRTLVNLFAQTAAAGTATFIPIYFIPLYFQFVRADTALEAGVRLLPFICLMILACIVNGAVMSATGVYMPWYLFGGIFVVIGGALLYTVGPTSSPSRIYGYSIFSAIGSGAYAQASFSVAQAKVSPADIPLAIGFITCAQLTGVTISLSIANSVFLNGSIRRIHAILPHVATKTIQSAVSGAGSSFFHSLDPATEARVLNAIVVSISKAYILAITAGSLSVVLAVFLKRERVFLQAGAGG